MSLLRSASVLALASLALAASAAPAVYTESAVASGILNGTSFTNARVTITLLGDTANATYDPSIDVYLVPGAATVSVDGLGSDALTGDLAAFSSQSGVGGGIQDRSVGLDILDTFNAAFGSYDLLTSFGPVEGDAAFNPPARFATLLGTFGIEDGLTSTFEARVSPVPEPASFAALGLGAVAMLRRRRRA